jgi:uncharacterized damage-inducible protein DinB
MHLSSKSLSLLACCLTVATSVSAFSQAMTAKPAVGTAVSPATSYNKLLAGEEKEFVDAAEAMPEDKFNFAPPETAGEFKGVRSFAGQVKHVAGANYYFFGNLSEAEAKAKEDSIEKLTSKADIIQALKDSFGIAHTYMGNITATNVFVMTKSGTPGGAAAMGLAHLMDHYGQMVVYLRMNGIVPPASRGGM